MATTATAARDILATSNRDNLTAVAARSVPVKRSHPLPLPTPPNSISPNLAPHGLRAQLLQANLEPVVPDLDLSDKAADYVAPRFLPEDPSVALTPAVLAKYYLPDILLNHGPLALRHITGYLTSSVPGFAAVPPTKARRLVVGALECRGSGGDGGDVVFEKIGWGRWDARRRAQPTEDRAAYPFVPDRSSPYLPGIDMPTAGGATWSNERTRLVERSCSPGNSVVLSHDDGDFYMNDHDVDTMSLSGSAYESEAPEDDNDVTMDDPEDVTDDEDWAAIGAAGLRAAAYPESVGRPSILSPRFHLSGMAKAPQMSNLDYVSSRSAPDAQEREAIEVLLRLGSV